MRLAFLQPDIPQNLGAAIRLAACFGVPLDLIEPCGFPLTDRALKRSMMDYGARADIVRHDGWAAFLEAKSHIQGRLVLFTTHADLRLDEAVFRAGDTLLFGRESEGASEAVHVAADARILVPLATGARSLNVAMTAGIALFEALRQTGGLPGRSTSPLSPAR